jgi:MFS superfamily sulfate permease-like transporter
MKHRNGTTTITMIMQNPLEIICVILIMFTTWIMHIIYG